MIAPRASDRIWPATLRHDDVLVRPLRVADAATWRRVRERNAEWLRPWEATAPPSGDAALTSYRDLARRLRRSGRAQTTLPFVVEVDGAFAGQVTVNNVVRGSALFASVGYWVDSQVAGRGVIPRAVALVIDHCLASGLHRIEIAIRPENSNSLRVVEKLGIREIGFAPCYLHIDGEWRDHRLYAITTEEWPPGGLLARVLSGED